MSEGKKIMFCIPFNPQSFAIWTNVLHDSVNFRFRHMFVLIDHSDLSGHPAKSYRTHRSYIIQVLYGVKVVLYCHHCDGSQKMELCTC